MKLKDHKIIYVDVDGTICDNPMLPTFDDQPLDYTKATSIHTIISFLLNILFLIDLFLFHVL